MPTVTKSFSAVQLTSTYKAYTYLDGSHSVSDPTTAKSTTVSFTLASMGIPAGATIDSAKFTFGLTSPAHGTLIRELNFNGTATSPVSSGVSVTLKDSNSLYFRFKSGTANTSYPGTPQSSGVSPAVKTNSSAINLTDIVLTVIYTLPYTACTPPTTLSFPSAYANPGDTARLSWSGATAGTGNPITGYEVRRAATSGGTYLLVDTTSNAYLDVAAPSTQGGMYYFKVKTLGTASGYDSDLSTAVASLKGNSKPAAPALTGPKASRTIYNSRPRALLTVGADPDGHQQTVAISGYTASTTGTVSAGKKIVLRKSSTLSPGSTSLTAVATDTEGLASLDNTVNFNYAVPEHSNTPIYANSTPIKAADINELRTMINNIRLYYGMAAYAWAEAVTAGTTSLGGWKDHVLELRGAIDDIVSLVNGWDTASSTHNIPAISWISIPTNTPSKAVMDQLRAVIPTL